MSKKVEVGQTVVFVKPQFRGPVRILECKVLKVGRVYFTLDDHRTDPTRIRIENFEEADCDNNRGRVFLSMVEYLAERDHEKASSIIREAVRGWYRIFDNVKTADLLKIAELLGIDMSKMEEKKDD